MRLDDYSLQMVALMLDDLSGEALEGLDSGLERFILVADPDLAEARRFPGALQRQAPLFRLVLPFPLENLGIEHQNVLPFIVQNNNPYRFPNHIGRHAYATVPMGVQRIQQVLADGRIRQVCRTGWPAEEKNIFANRSYHILSSSAVFPQRLWRTGEFPFLRFFPVFGIMAILLRKERLMGSKYRKYILFLLYCAVMLWLLLARTPNEAGVSFPLYLQTHFNPVPFQTIRRFSRLLRPPVRPYLVRIALRNLLGNVVLFIPLGYFLPEICNSLRKFWLTFLSVAVIITTIELTQLLCMVGTCDIDDLLLNLLGASLGYGLYRLTRRD